MNKPSVSTSLSMLAVILAIVSLSISAVFFARSGHVNWPSFIIGFLILLGSSRSLTRSLRHGVSQ